MSGIRFHWVVRQHDGGWVADACRYRLGDHTLRFAPKHRFRLLASLDAWKQNRGLNRLYRMVDEA